MQAEWSFHQHRMFSWFHKCSNARQHILPATGRKIAWAGIEWSTGGWNRKVMGWGGAQIEPGKGLSLCQLWRRHRSDMTQWGQQEPSLEQENKYSKEGSTCQNSCLQDTADSMLGALHCCTGSLLRSGYPFPKRQLKLLGMFCHLVPVIRSSTLIN